MLECRAHLRGHIAVLLLARFLPLLLSQLFRCLGQIALNYFVTGGLSQSLTKLFDRRAPFMPFPKRKAGVVGGVGCTKSGLALRLPFGRLLRCLLRRDLFLSWSAINRGALLSRNRRS